MILLGSLSKPAGGCLEFQGQVRSVDMAAQDAMKFVLSPEQLFICEEKSSPWKISRPSLFVVGGQS